MLLDRDATRQHHKEAEGREGTSGEDGDRPADLPTRVLHGPSFPRANQNGKPRSDVISWNIEQHVATVKVKVGQKGFTSMKQLLQ